MILLVFLLLFFIIPSPTNAQTRTDIDIPMTKKVMVINFNPIIESSGGQRLIQVLGLQNPDLLNLQYIQDLKTTTSNVINYTIVESRLVDDIPRKLDGFDYTDESYLNCWFNSTTCHSADISDYYKIINDFDLCGKRNRGEIDEVWIWGGPYFGFAEWTYAGPSQYNNFSSYWVGTSCIKLLPIMGFNYQRPLDQMHHDLSHRLESLMQYTYGSWQAIETHMWNRFSLLNKDVVGRAGCGNTHFPPNGTSDYDYGNPTAVSSGCEDWLNYPNLTGARQSFNCTRWGCSELGYHRWYFAHVPKYTGIAPDGKLNNWWRYVLEYEEAIGPPASPLTSPVASPVPSILPGDICSTNVTLTACNASPNNCAWYACAYSGQGGCFTEGTPINVVCPVGSPVPTSSPSYTVTDLRNIIASYRGVQVASIPPQDGRINMLDASYIIKWLH